MSKHNISVNDVWKTPKKEFLELPYIISFPRTGTHWLNTMLELYFDRNRVIPNYAGTITFVNKLNHDFMWYSAHDENLILGPPENKLGTLYLYRDPVDTLHSLVQAHTAQPDHNEIGFTQEQLVEKWSDRYQKHLSKWLLQKEFNVRTAISYEELKKDTVAGLQKAVKHFHESHKFVLAKAKTVTDIVTKEKVHERGAGVMSAYFGQKYLTEDYKKERDVFRERYADKIYTAVITKDLEPWFVHIKR
jgi:hypothetical protein